LARAVSELASRTPEELASIGAAGQAYCLREFDRLTQLDQLNRWLQEMASLRVPECRARRRPDQR
jgi:hypothetical protein